nr:hypothetical protein CFP56_42193 [Quercus suber]
MFKQGQNNYMASQSMAPTYSEWSVNADGIRQPEANDWTVHGGLGPKGHHQGRPETRVNLIPTRSRSYERRPDLQ